MAGRLLADSRNFYDCCGVLMTWAQARRLLRKWLLPPEQHVELVAAVQDEKRRKWRRHARQRREQMAALTASQPWRDAA